MVQPLVIAAQLGGSKITFYSLPNIQPYQQSPPSPAISRSILLDIRPSTNYFLTQNNSQRSQPRNSRAIQKPGNPAHRLQFSFHCFISVFSFVTMIPDC